MRASEALPFPPDQPERLARVTAAFGAEPAVTLVVPTFRRPAMLGECLESISKQTYGGFLALVCDNSPGQEARSIVEDFADERFIYRPRERNLGIAKNVIKGFLEARTPYVMEVDDDDILYPHCLETLLMPYLQHPSLTIVFADVDVTDANRHILPFPRRLKHLPSLNSLDEGIHQPFIDLAAYGQVFMTAALLRRDAIEWSSVPASADFSYDRYLALAAARGNSAGYLVRDAVMAYQVYPSGGLRRTTEGLLGVHDILTSELAIAPPSSRRCIEKEVVRTKIRLIRAYREEKEPASAIRQACSLLTPSRILRLILFVLSRWRLARRVNSDSKHSPLWRSAGPN